MKYKRSLIESDSEIKNSLFDDEKNENSKQKKIIKKNDKKKQLDKKEEEKDSISNIEKGGENKNQDISNKEGIYVYTDEKK